MHTILHIGAGQASELPKLLETGAEQIILVEPNPGLARKLRQRAAQHPQVTVVEAAITTSSDNNQLHEFNLPEACSIHPATGLKALFPGLKINATHTVATLSPDQLLVEHGPQPGQRALLAIQVPGEEHALLQTLISTDQLKQFSDLWVSANPEPYYQGSVPAENTLRALVDYGYQITDENQQDPDWPFWQLARNPLKDEISSLQAENEELKAHTTQLKEALEQNQQQKVHAEKQLEKQQAQVAREQGELKERNTQIDVLNASSQQHEEKTVQSLQAKVEAEKQLAEQQQLLAEKVEQLNDFRKNVEIHKTETVEQKKALEKAKSQLNETGKDLEKSRKTLAEAQDAYHKSTVALAKEQADHQLTTSAFEEKNQQFLSRKKQAQKLEAELEGLKPVTEKLIADSQGYKKQVEAKDEALKRALQQFESEQRAHQETSKALEDYIGWPGVRKNLCAELEDKLEEQSKELESLRLQLQGLEDLKEDLKKSERKAAERQDQVAELAETNRKHTYNSQKLNDQMNGLGKELIKAETQMATIKTLILDQ